MAKLDEAARDLDQALEATSRAVAAYFDVALAAGREASDGATYRGLSATQLRKKLQQFVVARLSPKPLPGKVEPVLQFDGAPQARRYVVNHPLPGLS